MTRYRRGRQAEYWYRDELLAQGYHTVVRAAASKGKWDLVAIGEQHIKLVAVKRTQHKRPPSYVDELNVLRADIVPDCCQKEMAIFCDAQKAWVIVPIGTDSD